MYVAAIGCCLRAPVRLGTKTCKWAATMYRSNAQREAQQRLPLNHAQCKCLTWRAHPNVAHRYHRYHQSAASNVASLTRSPRSATFNLAFIDNPFQSGTHLQQCHYSKKWGYLSGYCKSCHLEVLLTEVVKSDFALAVIVLTLAY